MLYSPPAAGLDLYHEKLVKIVNEKVGKTPKVIHVR
jgi:hypothetical protein